MNISNLTKQDIEIINAFSNEKPCVVESILNTYKPSEEVIFICTLKAIESKNFYFLIDTFNKFDFFRFNIYYENFSFLHKIITSCDIFFINDVFQYFKFNTEDTNNFIFYLFNNNILFERTIHVIFKTNISNYLSKDLIKILSNEDLKIIKKEISLINNIKNF